MGISPEIRNTNFVVFYFRSPLSPPPPPHPPHPHAGLYVHIAGCNNLLPCNDTCRVEGRRTQQFKRCTRAPTKTSRTVLPQVIHCTQKDVEFFFEKTGFFQKKPYIKLIKVT
jgi:hypothetical protein